MAESKDKDKGKKKVEPKVAGKPEPETNNPALKQIFVEPEDKFEPDPNNPNLGPPIPIKKPTESQIVIDPPLNTKKLDEIRQMVNEMVETLSRKLNNG